MSRQRYIRPIRIEGSLAYVALSSGDEAVIDAQDADLVKDSNWHLLKTKRADGTIRSRYVISTYFGGQKTYVYFHRVVFNSVVPRGYVVDHINGNTLDNRKANLRLASRHDNARNCKIPIDNKSGFKGVIWRPREKKWYAQISVNKKTIYLGTFDDPHVASEAYQLAAKKYFGEFFRPA